MRANRWVGLCGFVPTYVGIRKGNVLRRKIIKNEGESMCAGKVIFFELFSYESLTITSIKRVL